MITLAIIILILVGILLLFLEFFVVPGVTIAGIGGFALITTGIVVAYINFPPFYGHLTLALTVICLILFFIYVFYGKGMKKVSLNTEITSKVNEIEEEIQVGQTGIAISRLAPMGKIMVNEKFYEAEATNDFIDQNIEIEIVKVLKNKLIVKKLNK